MALRDGLGKRVVGVDTSQAMLEKFKRKAEGKGVTMAAVEASGSANVRIPTIVVDGGEIM